MRQERRETAPERSIALFQSDQQQQKQHTHTSVSEVKFITNTTMIISVLKKQLFQRKDRETRAQLTQLGVASRFSGLNRLYLPAPVPTGSDTICPRHVPAVKSCTRTRALIWKSPIPSFVIEVSPVAGVIIILHALLGPPSDWIGCF